MKRGIQMIEKNYNELPMLLEPKDLENIFSIDMRLVYEIIKLNEFPKLRISDHKIKIPKILLIKWINKNKEFLMGYRKIV
ncbi:hypothetical protein FC816_00565 [Clostridium botulinum]|uniref:Uncharacterized protein n=2 Tax=Clostridium botulinum TaxID=1491 RepID=A0A6B4G292_CLOBO|nr:hypothetical protein [Clostridium botulinum]NFF90090.1 hypothetical protein [Clostridium botulinum]NFG16876.1 hypothetical protein [Clostridium botulinum]NFG30641.1 hypothetical protein [Clostridium botulinum]NFG33784.1 hypothetical protein [Clostridium botulinum]